MTRTVPRLLLAIGVAAALAGCGAAATPAPAGPAPTSEAAATTTAAEEAGFLVETPEFSVRFPSEPQEQTQEVPDVPGATSTTYVADAQDSAVTMSVTDFPAELDFSDTTTLLEGQRDNSIANVPGAELTDSTATTTPEGLPALDYSATVSGGTLLSRIVIDGNRLYQLISIGASDRAAAHEELLSSFTIV